MWNLDKSLELIRTIQPIIKRWDYHVLLGGGILNKSKSDKDLDLFFVPLNGSDGNQEALFSYLMNIMQFKGAIRDAPDYGSGNLWHWERMEKFEFENKRVDVFILK